jgi:biopolymer transport protein ExbD
MKIDLGDDETPLVDMAPMIDCVFLLLIFFLVAATIRKKHNELPIELPAAENAIAKKADDSTLVISVYREGTAIRYAMTTVGEKTQTGGGGIRETVTFNKLLSKMKEKRMESPSRMVRVDADKDIPYGKVSQVIDHLELYQFEKVGLRTLD